MAEYTEVTVQLPAVPWEQITAAIIFAVIMAMICLLSSLKRRSTKR